MRNPLLNVKTHRCPERKWVDEKESQARIFEKSSL
jgi:hypothetical protein